MSNHGVDDDTAADHEEASADGANEDVLRLARIAIFCSAFGAAILLAVAMCVLNGSPPAPPTALQNLIEVNLFIVNPPMPSSVPARFNLKVGPPGKPLIDLPLDGLVNGGPIKEFTPQDGEVYAVGLTLRNDISAAPSPDGWVGRLLIFPNSSRPGPWQFAAWWGNGGVVDGEDGPAESTPPTVTLRIYITSNASDGKTDQSFALSYGAPSSSVYSPD